MTATTRDINVRVSKNIKVKNKIHRDSSRQVARGERTLVYTPTVKIPSCEKETFKVETAHKDVDIAQDVEEKSR